jgi:L-ascorbate metabolism protein UlaG (beta-lactamase superfamily)
VLLDLDGTRVLTDPLLVDRLGLLHRHTEATDKMLADIEPDLVLISHGHHDHLHVPSLRRLRGRPRIVVPTGLGRLLERRLDVVEVDEGQEIEIGSVRIRAMPALHHGGRRPFGPVSTALGFLIAGSTRVYFAGDTDLFPGMAGLAGKVDVALLPVWGWGPRLGSGHLDPARAAEAVVRIAPRVAIPIHWGTFYPFAFARIWPLPLATPPKDFAREVALRAADTEVRILAPGEATELPPAPSLRSER